MEEILVNEKTALITGADRGIGYAVAKKLFCSGYRVCASYLHAFDTAKFLEETNGLNEQNRLWTYQADVTNLEQINQLFALLEQTFGALHLLVNNAGVTLFAPFLETTPEQWDAIVSTDWKGAYFCTQQAAKNMLRHGQKGTIINISSNQAVGCWPNASVYGPAKCALTKFGMHAAMELAPYGIRVITLAPGYTDTGWGKSENAQQIHSKIPLGRFATPEEIASLIPFLDSRSTAYLTGCCITADGGALLPVVPENTYSAKEG